MSYTPRDQHLSPAIDKIREGIKEFQAAAQARIDEPNEWDRSHLWELAEIRKSLTDLDIKLAIMGEWTT